MEHSQIRRQAANKTVEIECRSPSWQNSGRHQRQQNGQASQSDKNAQPDFTRVGKLSPACRR